MKKLLQLLLTTIISLNTYSQISFEKGYYINNFGRKFECLIKNEDWKNNPTDFSYKQSENSEILNANINNVKEFVIYNDSKYIRSTVKIDESSTDTENLSVDKNPEFVEKQLFLKVLIEGKSNLYIYDNGNLKFFYKTENSDLQQLVYKIYLYSDDKIGENNLFKQQLWNDLKCPTIELNKVENLNYDKNSLLDFFIEYNKCNKSEFKNYEEKEKKDLFNLTIRARLNNSSLTMENSKITSSYTDFGNKLGFGFGVEAEVILPINKNKWAIAVEPTYQSFNSIKTTDMYFSGGKISAKVNYVSIELPLSLRYYSFINKNSKIFYNVSYILDFSADSSIDLERTEISYSDSLEINSRNNFAFGIGYKFKDKYCFEMRFQTSRDVLGDYLLWDTNYNTLSMIFGYSLL
jgi:hypothetical protein